jgi:glycosyltransferase involved in cell wall biosynthesis
MPYIVLEALAAGKPVIASRVGGIPEVLGESSEALAIPGDAQDLSSIMTAAATQPDWRIRTMPKPSAFKSVFSAQVMARDMLGLYRDALRTGNGKPA